MIVFVLLVACQIQCYWSCFGPSNNYPVASSGTHAKLRLPLPLYLGPGVLLHMLSYDSPSPSTWALGCCWTCKVTTPPPPVPGPWGAATHAKLRLPLPQYLGPGVLLQKRVDELEALVRRLEEERSEAKQENASLVRN